MNLLRSAQERFGFTRNELIALLSLAVLFLTGSAVKVWLPPTVLPATHPTFSYAALDSQFLALAHSPRDTATATRSSRPRKRAALPASASIAVNSAPPEELERLPGVGPALARRIVTYRETAGAFRSVEDLRKVKGIGPRTLERIRPFVQVLPTPRHAEP